MNKSDGIKKGENSILTIHQKVIQLKKDILNNFYKLGAYLKEIRDEKIYVDLGYDTFESYIATPELSFKRSMVYSLIGVYETYFEKSNQSDINKFKEIDMTKLDRIRQFKDKPKEEFQEWIEKARELSLSDLNAEIKIERGEKEDVNEVYIPRKIYPVICPKCGHSFDHII